MFHHICITLREIIYSGFIWKLSEKIMFKGEMSVKYNLNAQWKTNVADDK